MPGIRERDANDKIKGKGGGRAPKEARRLLTAKFRKELAQRQRKDPETYGGQAVGQTEEIAGASVEEVGGQAGKAVGKAAGAVRKAQQKKRRERQEERREAPAQNGDPRRREIHPAADDGLLPTDGRPAHTAEPPTPQERMRRRAAQQRRELAGRPMQTPSLREGGQPSASPHYGQTPHTSRTVKENRSFKNQSIDPIDPSIRERPRRSHALREKPPGGAFTPKARRSVERAAKQAAPVKASAASGKAPAMNRVMEQARKRSRQEAQRQMLQRSQKAAKAAADLSKRAVTATVKTVRALTGALSALVGGAALLAALCVVMLIAAVIASPFGILFSNEPSPGAVPLNAAVSQINMELTDKLADLQAGDYDTIDIQGQPPDWREVAAVFASKTAGAGDGVDVAALTPDRVERLRAVFWDMCAITTETETIDHPASGDSEGWTEKILHITISPKVADDMRTQYSFSKPQNDALTELLAELDSLGALLGDLSVSQEQARSILQNLPANLNPERRAVVENACKLAGKVTYFWGGKSLVLGWDSRWGQLRKVTAAGSSTTGTYRPYGLDCSGCGDWGFYNAAAGSYIIGHGGGAHAQHTYCTDITWDEARPGDLVFYPEDTHVGIVGGWDADGNILIIHCASGANNVVITGASGFTSIGRPQYYGG